MNKFIIMLTFCVAIVGAPLTTQAAQCIIKSYAVNDYGRVGPERDAQALLDQYINDWAVTAGVKRYSVSQESVSCKLFLDALLFTEYTCRAEARVCWTGPRRHHKATHRASLR
jgi:hypothetical protein